MTGEEYRGVNEAQIAMLRLTSMLTILSEATDDCPLIDALDLCASYAKAAAMKVDTIPGYIEAQRLS